MLQYDPKNNQVPFTDSVAIVTDSEYKLPPFLKQTTQSSPHFWVNTSQCSLNLLFETGPRRQL